MTYNKMLKKVKNLGRPRKYNNDIIREAKTYLSQFNLQDEQQLEEIPTIAGLALFIGIDKSTVHSWNKHKEWKAITDALNAIQEAILISRGLNKKKFNYSSNIVKLLLGNHGYTDKTEVEQTNTIITGFEIIKPENNKELNDSINTYKELQEPLRNAD